MVLRTLLLLAFLLTFFVDCKSPTDEIAESFDTVNASLTKSDSMLLGGQYLPLYDEIQKKREKDPQLAAEVDQFVLAVNDARQLIDSLKQALIRVDSTLERTDVAAKFLNENTIEPGFTNKLKAVYRLSASLTKNEFSYQVDSLFQFGKEMEANPNWMSGYFERTPTVAVITILSKLENDCLNLAVFTLERVKSRFN